MNKLHKHLTQRELLRAVPTCPSWLTHALSFSNEGRYHPDACCAALQTHSSWQQSSMSQGFCQQIQVSYFTFPTTVIYCLCCCVPCYNMGMPLLFCEPTTMCPQCGIAFLLFPGISDLDFQCRDDVLEVSHTVWG